jgi:hypothetical protein
VNTLKRYGIEWTGPKTPIAVPMKDGHWTPWHLAQERIAELEDALEESHRVAEVLNESNGNYADFNKKLQEEVQELTNQLIAMHKGELHD